MIGGKNTFVIIRTKISEIKPPSMAKSLPYYNSSMIKVIMAVLKNDDTPSFMATLIK